MSPIFTFKGGRPVTHAESLRETLTNNFSGGSLYRTTSAGTLRGGATPGRGGGLHEGLTSGLLVDLQQHHYFSYFDVK